MKDEQKASDIVLKIQNRSSLDYDARRANYMYDAAIEMAAWKDMQFIEYLTKMMEKADDTTTANYLKKIIQDLQKTKEKTDEQPH